MASPIEVLHSRQKRPLLQDDSLRRGEIAPRVFRELAGIAVIARHRAESEAR